MRETRTVHFRIDPALSAYMEWCDATRRTFDLEEFDLFAAGYRARDALAAARSTAAPAEGEVCDADAV